MAKGAHGNTLGCNGMDNGGDRHFKGRNGRLLLCVAIPAAGMAYDEVWTVISVEGMAWREHRQSFPY